MAKLVVCISAAHRLSLDAAMDRLVIVDDEWRNRRRNQSSGATSRGGIYASFVDNRLRRRVVFWILAFEICASGEGFDNWAAARVRTSCKITSRLSKSDNSRDRWTTRFAKALKELWCTVNHILFYKLVLKASLAYRSRKNNYKKNLYLVFHLTL